MVYLVDVVCSISAVTTKVTLHLLMLKTRLKLMDSIIHQLKNKRINNEVLLLISIFLRNGNLRFNGHTQSSNLFAMII